MTERPFAHQAAQVPEDLNRLFVERVNAGDVEGLVALYERDAVLNFPPGQRTVGLDAIRRVLGEMVASLGPPYVSLAVRRSLPGPLTGPPK